MNLVKSEKETLQTNTLSWKEYYLALLLRRG